MKKIILFIAIIFTFSTNLFAQDYYIYKTEGEIKISTGDGQWKEAIKRDILKTTSKVHIPKAGSIVIVEQSTNKIITYNKPGEYTVREIVSNAQTKSESLFASINKKLAKDIQKENNGKTKYVVSGSVKRGGGIQSEATFGDSLYAAIYNYIKKELPTRNDKLELRKILLPDQQFYFEIENNSDELLYVNILVYNAEKSAFAYKFSQFNNDQLPLRAGKKAILKDSPFIEDDNSSRYILIALPKPYRSSSVSHDLSKMTIPIYDTPLSNVIFSE